MGCSLFLCILVWSYYKEIWISFHWGFLNLDKQDLLYNYSFFLSLLLIWILFNTLFPFCELSYACAKCFSSGPLVFPGPIFMNHREQALARIRPHPAQLKHKRDKHKGIWTSFLARVEISRSSHLTSSMRWICLFKEMHKMASAFLLVSILLPEEKENAFTCWLFMFFKCKCLVVCVIFVFLSPCYFLSWKMHCFPVSFLMSKLVSFLRFFHL